MILKNSSHGHDSQIKKESDQDLQEKKIKRFSLNFYAFPLAST